jgi:hypothetical protein
MGSRVCRRPQTAVRRSAQNARRQRCSGGASEKAVRCDWPSGALGWLRGWLGRRAAAGNRIKDLTQSAKDAAMGPAVGADGRLSRRRQFTRQAERRGAACSTYGLARVERVFCIHQWKYMTINAEVAHVRSGYLQFEDVTKPLAIGLAQRYSCVSNSRSGVERVFCVGNCKRFRRMTLASNRAFTAP